MKSTVHQLLKVEIKKLHLLTFRVVGIASSQFELQNFKLCYVCDKNTVGIYTLRGESWQQTLLNALKVSEWQLRRIRGNGSQSCSLIGSNNVTKILPEGGRKISFDIFIKKKTRRNKYKWNQKNVYIHYRYVSSVFYIFFYLNF